jgi:NTP pyrophosphatase (non-canonical NTP hydrolase)
MMTFRDFVDQTERNIHEPDDIQRRALETWHDPLLFPDELQIDHAVLGLVGEAGEVANQYKKHLFKPGHQSTRKERLLELGDVLYYMAILAHMDGATIDDVSQLNYEKPTKNGDNHGWAPNWYLYDADRRPE